VGTTTSNLGLYKPDVGEVSWGDLRNNNEDVVDVALGAQHATSGIHNFITVTDDTGYVQLPSLSTTQRDALPAANGMMIYNITVGQIQSYESGVWANTAVGTATFSDADFRVYDDGDPTKRVAIQASAITTATTRTITMPDEDIDLGDVSANTTHRTSDGKDHSDVVTNNAKVTNATHTTDVTGSAALTLDPVAITNKPAAAVANGDLVVVSDIDDSNALKQVTAQSIANLGAGGAPITVEDEGTPLTNACVLFDFAGAGVTVTEPVADQVLVTIPGGGGYVDPMTTRGDVLIRNPSNVTDRLAIGGVGEVLTSEGTEGSWAAGGGGGATLTEDVNQSTHGFSVNDWLYNNGTIYVLADASAPSTSESIGIVSAVAGVDDFTIQFGGYITGLSGLTAGESHFLSETAGEITATAPSTEGSVVKPVLIADSTTTGFIFNMRGIEVTGTTSWYQEFGSGDLAAGVLTVNHNLGHIYCVVQVYDENDALIQPDDVTLTDANNLDIDLSSFTVTASGWHAVVLDIGTTTSSPNLTGDVTSVGIVTTNVTNANLTGVVTSVGNATAIADKALAIAKLADGVDGELITWDGSGVIDTVAAGNVGDVLTSAGAGDVPTFQAPSGGGGSSLVYSYTGLDLNSSWSGESRNPPNSSTDTVLNTMCTVGKITTAYFKYKKEASVSTLTCYTRAWYASAEGTYEMKYTVGGQTHASLTGTNTSPAWMPTRTIDVSGLSDGTVYDGTVYMGPTNSSIHVFCLSIAIFGS